MQYSKERKNAIINKMKAPNSKTIPELSKEEGISEPTLYNWRQEARSKGILLPNGEKTPNGWSSTDMFAAVVESASFNEEELAQYCRKNAVFPEQVHQWREACENANDWDKAQNKTLKSEIKESKFKVKELERELRRKEKALAETAALLVLKKKAQFLWGEDEEQ